MACNQLALLPPASISLSALAQHFNSLDPHARLKDGRIQGRKLAHNHRSATLLDPARSPLSPNPHLRTTRGTSSRPDPLVLRADNRTGKTITVPVEHNAIPATAFKKLRKDGPEAEQGDRQEDEVEVRCRSPCPHEVRMGMV